MNPLHSLLKRQLRRFADETIPLIEEQQGFIRAINDAYWQFDADRRMLEHSLELTSQELLERNAELSRINAELELRVAARTAELSGSEARFRGLFEYAPMSIWEEDFSAVRHYLEDLRTSGVTDFVAYFEVHPQAVAECAARVKIVDVNRATLEMYQAESKAQLLADLSRVLGPDSLIPFKQELLALARGETSFENETVNYTLRGERRVVIVRLTVAPSYVGTWAKVFVGISDITERRQAEAALAAERDLLQALMDNIPDTIYFKDTASRFTRINRAQVRVLGVAAPEDAIGKTDLDFQDSKLAQAFYEEEQRIVETGEPLTNRIEFNPTSDGQPRWFSATKVPIRDADGQVSGIVGISRNITESMLAEKKFRGLLEAAPDAVVVVDKGGMIQLVNSQSENMFGYDRAEIIGQPVERLVPAQLQGIHQRHRAKFFADPKLRPMGIGLDLHGLRRDGSQCPIEISLSPLEAEDGLLVIAAIRDITERRGAENALREAETKYRTLVENMAATVYIDMADEPHATLYISPQVREMLGYAPEDWIAKPEFCNDIVHPEDSQRMWKEAEESQTRGRFAGEYRYIAKDGRVVWVHDEAVLLEGDGEAPAVWQGVMLDITAQKEAEEALRQSEERFRLMSWATKDAVWDWDLQKNQIWWGEGLQKILHYPADGVQPDPEWRLDHIHAEDRHKVNRVISQALEGGMEFWSKEYRFKRNDGTYADVMDRGYILRDETGNPSRMIGAMMDITERKLNEETIRKQNEMLSSLHEITLDLLRQRELDSLLKALVELSAKFLDASYVEIMLVEEEALVVKAATPNQTRLIGARLGRADAMLSWQAVDTREPAVLRDYASWPHRQAMYDEFLPHAVADFPILNDAQCLGVIALGREKPDYEFTMDEIQYGRLFANLMALVLNNAQLREALREQSIRDPLTGLYNRRYMEEMLSQQISRVTRQLHPLGVIMIDIDHFKRFNDTHGHAVGDVLLREVGRLLQRCIRLADVACRYGGEEFILIMPDVSVEAAQQRAEELREAAKVLRARDAGQIFEGITLSLGVAIYPQHGRTKEAVLRAADSALYRAKQEGRNRVMVAESVH